MYASESARMASKYICYVSQGDLAHVQTTNSLNCYVTIGCICLSIIYFIE